MQNSKKAKYALNSSGTNNSKSKKKINIKVIIAGVIVVTAALIALKMYFLDDIKDNKKTLQGIEKLDDNYNTDKGNSSSKHNKNGNKSTTNDKSQIKKINWKDFSQDTKAVLEIPGMLEYPVVQSKDNNFYLHRGLDKHYKYSGTLFIDYHNNSDFTDDNTIIYGHNMTSGRMFGNLKKYKSKSYLAQHRYFFVHTRKTGNTSVEGFSQDGDNYDELLKYEIKNVCVVNLGSKIYTIQFGDNFTQEDYIKRYHGLFGNSLDKDKTICTLSTCTNFGRQRLVIQGSLVSRELEQN